MTVEQLRKALEGLPQDALIDVYEGEVRGIHLWGEFVGKFREHIGFVNVDPPDVRRTPGDGDGKQSRHSRSSGSRDRGEALERAEPDVIW